MGLRRGRKLSVLTGPVYVLQTWFAPHHHDTRVYRVECGWDARVIPLLERLIFHTDNPDVFADALDCEGQPITCMAYWHHDDTDLVLDRLQLHQDWRKEVARDV